MDLTIGDLLKEWIAKFNASQADVAVEPVAIPYSAYTKTIFTQLGGGQGPDVIRFDLQDYYTAANAGSLAELNLGADYSFRGPDSYLLVDGKRHGMLFEISSYSLIYNPDLIEGGKAPATFEEFVAVARAATKDGHFG